MFTQLSPIRAVAVQINFGRLGKHSVLLISNAEHYAITQLSLQELHHRTDTASALTLYGFPLYLRQRFDLDRYLIEFTASYHRINLPFTDP